MILEDVDLIGRIVRQEINIDLACRIIITGRYDDRSVRELGFLFVYHIPAGIQRIGTRHATKNRTLELLHIQDIEILAIHIPPFLECHKCRQSR